MKHGTEVLRAYGWRFQFAYVHDRVWSHGTLYLERRMLELFGFSLRYHVFHASDPDRALHDHPWWFVTFPLDGYWQYTQNQHGGTLVDWYGYVKPRRFHFRSATYRHRVIVNSPVRTIVLTGRRTRGWGFWPDGKFVPWREYEG